MRIQHNIPAMNAYRNYNANTKALQGNLQKLSSGYKINKAGDDAAGLAISEKMRAQITGLEVAQKNAKDGISLVQTAEGALTEVHTMLNRMYSLAEQSANGTYADDVDREQLQKEVVSLREEIDRIADASNFNGKKLLDGSLGGGSKSGGAGAISTSLATKTVEATKGSYETEALGTQALTTGPVKVSFTFSDGNGNDSVVNFELTAGVGSDGTTANKGIYVNGKLACDGTGGTAGTLASGDWENILNSAFKEIAPDVLDNFSVSVDTNGKATFEAKEAGTGKMQLVSYGTSAAGGTGAATSGKITTTAAADAFDTIDVSKIHTWDGTEADLEKSIFEIGGEKFVIIENGTTVTNDMKALLSKSGVGNNSFVAGNATPNNADAQSLANLVNKALGTAAEDGQITGTPPVYSQGTGTLVALKPGSAKLSAGSSGGLTLQIGDTSDEYNKMTVSVNDCHAKAIGVGSVDIGTQEGASAAMTSIKDAINYVSDVRGTLGALQNRLDHTINNLSVQQENIQDAEATIRDVDVANEMMAYTKNNILVQSAQAMLAQANQLPQGVLQLLG